MKKFRIGEHVVVPFGLGEIEGIVVDTFGPQKDPIVTVRIDFAEGCDDSTPSDIGFRASAVRRVAEPAHR